MAQRLWGYPSRPRRVGSITRSGSVTAFAREFPGQHLGLRLYFFCNMEVGEMK